MASPLADYVVSFGRDGRVASHGSALDAVAESLTVSPELIENVLDEEKRTDQEGPDAKAKQAETDGKLIVAEEIAEGQVSWDACNCQFFTLAVSLTLTWFIKLSYFSGVWVDPTFSCSG
jgi:hypothetical protein